MSLSPRPRVFSDHLAYKTRQSSTKMRRKKRSSLSLRSCFFSNRRFATLSLSPSEKMISRFLSKYRETSSSLLVFSIFLSCFPGFILSGVVTLDSIEIYKTHEWFKAKPTVYFKCKDENKTVLPDVKEKNVLYTFKGEESWQPLTELSDKKCKRCGFYEEDSGILNSDNVFEEWEFCLSDFTASDGKYVRFKDKEFNATFLCPLCKPVNDDSTHSTGPHKDGGNRLPVYLAIVVGVLVSIILAVVGAVAAYKYWQKRKREQDQARFLKLFEDGDDIEDELGLGDII